MRSVQTLVTRLFRSRPAMFLAGCTALVLGHPWFALSKGPSATSPGSKVVMIAIDGVRNLELQGKARDDLGRSINAAEIFPNLTALEHEGVLLSKMRISNPAGISLPAYADLLAGRRQERILSNDPYAGDLRSDFPTLFQAVKHGLKLGPDGVALMTSWDMIGSVALTTGGPAGDNDFYRSCGWKKDAFLKPEMSYGSRTDADTFLEFAREVPRRRPRFLFVQFVEADEEAHLHGTVRKRGGYYGIFHYHQALRQADYYVGRIWALLQSDPFYKDSTYLIVTTDHGRCCVPDPAQWADHGSCLYGGAKELCAGCRSVFGLAVGPGLKPQVCETPYTHIDLAPTIARLLDVPMPSATGRVIPEFLPER